MAGTKPNQRTTNGAYRVKLTSRREYFVYQYRVALGLDAVLGQNWPDAGYRWAPYTGLNVFKNKFYITGVRFPPATVYLDLEAPIGTDYDPNLLYTRQSFVQGNLEQVPPDANTPARLLTLSSIGFPGVGQVADQVFMDVKIGTYTKSGEQFTLEGANIVKRRLKQIEHDAKDIYRGSRDPLQGYDIDKSNVERFAAVTQGAQRASLRAAMLVVQPLLQAISQAMQAASDRVTFVGSSLLIVLDLNIAANSTVKLIDPDHPIVVLDNQGITNTLGILNPNDTIPPDVLTYDRIQRDANAKNAYIAKWTNSFATGMTQFLELFDAVIADL